MSAPTNAMSHLQQAGPLENDADRLRLLVVDDEAMMQELFRMLIPPQRYDMTFCQDAHSALNAFKAAPFDMVLSDCNMPGMRGEALACEINSLSPETPIVLMSGREIAPMDIPSVVGFLKKPFRVSELLASLEGALLA